jgi:hypothetical protein
VNTDSDFDEPLPPPKSEQPLKVATLAIATAATIARLMIFVLDPQQSALPAAELISAA